MEPWVGVDSGDISFTSVIFMISWLKMMGFLSFLSCCNAEVADHDGSCSYESVVMVKMMIWVVMTDGDCTIWRSVIASVSSNNRHMDQKVLGGVPIQDDRFWDVWLGDFQEEFGVIPAVMNHPWFTTPDPAMVHHPTSPENPPRQLTHLTRLSEVALQRGGQCVVLLLTQLEEVLGATQ